MTTEQNIKIRVLYIFYAPHWYKEMLENTFSYINYLSEVRDNIHNNEEVRNTLTETIKELETIAGEEK